MLIPTPPRYLGRLPRTDVAAGRKKNRHPGSCRGSPECSPRRCVMRRMSLLVFLLLVPVRATADMPSEENIKAVAQSWLAKKPAKGFGVTMSMSEAAMVQARYTALIGKDLGEWVGSNGNPSRHAQNRPGKQGGVKRALAHLSNIGR